MEMLVDEVRHACIRDGIDARQWWVESGGGGRPSAKKKSGLKICQWGLSHPAVGKSLRRSPVDLSPLAWSPWSPWFPSVITLLVYKFWPLEASCTRVLALELGSTSRADESRVDGSRSWLQPPKTPKDVGFSLIPRVRFFVPGRQMRASGGRPSPPGFP